MPVGSPQGELQAWILGVQTSSLPQVWKLNYINYFLGHRNIEKKKKQKRQVYFLRFYKSYGIAKGSLMSIWQIAIHAFIHIHGHVCGCLDIHMICMDSIIWYVLYIC